MKCPQAQQTTKQQANEANEVLSNSRCNCSINQCVKFERTYDCAPVILTDLFRLTAQGTSNLCAPLQPTQPRHSPLSILQKHTLYIYFKVEEKARRELEKHIPHIICSQTGLTSYKLAVDVLRQIAIHVFIRSLRDQTVNKLNTTILVH